MRLIVFLTLYLYAIPSFCRATVYDSVDGQLHQLFSVKGRMVIIRYHHTFEDTLFVAENCEISFRGGSLKGPIVFNNTKLCGDVNIVGSSISGRIRNKIFNASWLCYKDGRNDDAVNINSILKVCPKIYFPSGEYRLVSEFIPEVDLKGEHYIKSVRAHIGIHRDNVELQGENGTVFSTNERLSILCVYSLPYNINGSVKNITIKNIELKTVNDGSVFREWTHAIKIIGVNGIKIEGCTITDFWGDAICLDHYGDTPLTGERTRNQEVFIHNNIIIGGPHHNNRNGISVINGKDVQIKKNTIKNTSRKDMPGGIDVEPNNSAYTIDNILIEDNTIDSIKGIAAIALFLPEGSQAHKLTIKNNRVYNSTLGIRICIVTDRTSDNITIVGNITDENTEPYIFDGTGISSNWIVSGNTFNRPTNRRIPGTIKVDNITIDNNKKKSSYTVI